ncbi:DC1 [Arabidopsis suecica]|uniref:DC1 n=1 Tax=Arabidopsis suecica TaxID=45249 RepID=A0A8T2BRG7_ARASU|nr:DC1 [Arabidopsis suecica]
MEPLKINLPFHEHPLTPVKIESACKWCGLKFNGVSDGYQCGSCIYGLFHKTCANNKNIAHPSQTCGNILYHTLNLERGKRRCAGCREKIYDDLYFICNDCVLVPTRRKGSFGSSYFHFNCAKYPPSEVIDVPQHHDHKLKLETVRSCFTCAACGKDCDGYSYKCHECNLKFHVNCEKYPAEVTHFSHSLHPLKLFKDEPPAYTDGKCRLCGEKLANSEVFYHCSTCNFSLDLQCVFQPPKQNPHDLNIHDHQLTIMPKSISFTCTTCGLNGDRSPYVCLPCDFTIHNDCSGFPWVININRHDHRVSRTSLIGVVNSVCGICRKKMDWSCGGYSCKRCPSYVFHTKCATREDVWDGKEMKDEPEEEEDIQPFTVIDENTIHHVSHEEHNLRLDKSGIFIKDRICEACVYPIYHNSFYSCMSCSFILHESCANLPLWKRHVVSNERYRYKYWDYFFTCMACGLLSNGFKYDATRSTLDVRCASVTEPFVHKSHPHPLFYTSPRGVCSVCKKEEHHVLRCVEDDCGYVMDYRCALLPYEVKHSVDHHFLSLCYGEENASGKYWCDICEKETDPKTWFYTSKDCELTLHTDCVLGDFRGLKPGIAEDEYVHHVRRDFKVLRNNSMSRPLCKQCKSRCIFPFFLETWNKNSIHNGYYCSESCFYS